MLSCLRLIFLAGIITIVLLLAGCQPIVMQPAPAPVIKTTTWKANHSTGIIVEYFYHSISTDNNGRATGPASISFTTSKEIKEYREQVQAMLKELTVIEDQIVAAEEEQKAHGIKKDP